MRRKNIKRACIEIVKYLFVGGISFIADYVTYWISSEFIYYIIATYLGLIIGLIVNYILSKYWVFKAKEKSGIILFIIFTIIGFALTGIGMYIGVDILEFNDKIVKFTVAVIVFIFNFLVRKFLIFKKNDKNEE